jgi:hypothetical protein
MVNKETKEIQICEGKIMKNCFLGVKQLDNLTMFINYLESYYDRYTVIRGLCMFANSMSEIDSIKDRLPYPIFFALDATGTMYY